jgi:hypothetical protein
MLECCLPHVVGIEIHTVYHGLNTFILEQIKFGKNCIGIHYMLGHFLNYTPEKLDKKSVLNITVLLLCIQEAPCSDLGSEIICILTEVFRGLCQLLLTNAEIVP